MQVWLNGEDQATAVKVAQFLDKRVKASPAELKAFLVILDTGQGKAQAESLAKAAGTQNVAVTYIKYGDHGSGEYKINTSKDVKNTVFVYKNIRVTDKFVNFKADEPGMKALAAAVDKIDKKSD